MRTKDLRTGVMYAYRTSKRAEPFAVMIVDLRVHSQNRSRDRLAVGPASVWQLMTNPHITPGGALYDDHHFGFPAAATRPSEVFSSNGAVGDVADLDGVTYDHVMATMGRDDYAQVIPGTSVFPMVVNPKNVIGEWETVMEKHAAEQELEADLAAIETARKQSLTDAKQQRIDALRALGLPGGLDDAPAADSYFWTERTMGSLTLTLAQVDALLSLVPDGATVPVPDPDAWEYPEGQR